MRRVSRRHCSAAPAANVRYKSAYFQIPSALRRTKAALYVAAEARRKDTNTGRQCVPAANNGDSVMSGWRMKTPTNKGWQEVADSVDGINIIEKLKLKTTSSSTEGAVLNWYWASAAARSDWLYWEKNRDQTGSCWFRHVWRFQADSTETPTSFHLWLRKCERLVFTWLFLTPVEQLIQTSSTTNQRR